MGCNDWQCIDPSLRNKGAFEPANCKQGVNAMQPQVFCSVSNCEYWEKNNRCNAEAIMIEIDRHANKSFDAEFAGESMDTEHRDTAVAAAETCCHTFKWAR